MVKRTAPPARTAGLSGHIVIPKTYPPALVEGAWYVVNDRAQSQRLRLLRILDTATVQIVDEAGNRRVVNRAIFEQMDREVPA
jgi:hypothetical protein